MDAGVIAATVSLSNDMGSPCGWRRSPEVPSWTTVERTWSRTRMTSGSFARTVGSEVDAGNRRQNRGVEVRIDRVCQTIEHHLAPRGEPGRAEIRTPSHAGLRSHLGQKGPPEPVILEGAMPGGPPYRPRAPSVQERLCLRTRKGEGGYP